MSVREPIKLKSLVEEGTVFNVDTDALHDIHKETDEDREYNENLLNFLNLQVTGDIEDEDTYVEGQPFEIIGSKMFKLSGDGNVSKRILREGYGEKAKKFDIVRVHYNAYIEFQAEPFDSTYARKKPQQFNVDNGEVLWGLDIAVQSMKLNEKSQFLLKPEVAYGVLGCLNRVPGNAEVLFEVELLEIVNVGAAAAYEALPEENQKNFKYVYEYCLALCAKGKDIYSKNVRGAIKEYNTAVGKLERAFLDDYNDQLKQEELLYKLYGNLIVCYTKIEEPRKSCINFNKIQNMVKGTSMKISAKSYYNNAKCLRMLGEYNLAKRRLHCAYKIEPNNPDILNEMLNLEEEMKTYKDKEVNLAKAFISGKN